MAGRLILTVVQVDEYKTVRVKAPRAVDRRIARAGTGSKLQQEIDLPCEEYSVVRRAWIGGTIEVLEVTPGESRVGKEEMNVSAEENKAVVCREQEELWNHNGNLDVAEEIFAPDYAEAAKQEAAKQEAADFRQGFPDLVSNREDLIAEGDKVVARLDDLSR